MNMKVIIFCVFGTLLTTPCVESKEQIDLSEYFIFNNARYVYKYCDAIAQTERTVIHQNVLIDPSTMQVIDYDTVNREKNYSSEFYRLEDDQILRSHDTLEFKSNSLVQVVLKADFLINQEWCVYKNEALVPTKLNVVGSDAKAKVVSTNEIVTTSVGEFNCIKVISSSPGLEGNTVSYYAKGIGMVRQQNGDKQYNHYIELIDFSTDKRSDISYEAPYFNGYRGEIDTQTITVFLTKSDDINTALSKALKEAFDLTLMINSVALKSDDKGDYLHLDISNFSLENLGRSAEWEISDQLYNGIGYFYKAKRLLITLDGQTLHGGHASYEFPHEVW